LGIKRGETKMTPTLVGFIGILVLLAVMALRLPIAFAMAATGFAGTWFLTNFSVAMGRLAIVPVDVVTSYGFSVLPLFIFMGQIIVVSEMGSDLFSCSEKWLGRMPGGLAVATIVAAAIFGAVSSAALAATVTIGLMALREMKRFNYDPQLATGCICVGGSLDTLIPPSSLFIIYGILTETSIGKLFSAGIVPGLILAIFYVITILIMCRLKPHFGPRGPKYTFKEKVVSFGKIGEIAGLILLVLGGILFGWFTPTEGGAVASLGAILFSLLRKRLNWKKFKEAAIGTMKVTGMMYCVVIGATLFQYFIAVSNLAFGLTDIIKGMSASPMIVMIAIIVFYLVLGTFMDELSMVLLTLPIFVPLIETLGFDKVFFGIIITRMSMIAGYSPPTGMILFAVKGIAPDVPFTTIYKGVLPFYIADIVHVALLLIFPAIAMFLPGLMGK
jgi:C4-dicarboxylate transporter, DctM subunit